MWNEEDMNRYSAQLELQETLVLRAILEEGLGDVRDVVTFVASHTNDFDLDYIECVFNMTTQPARIPLDNIGA